MYAVCMDLYIHVCEPPGILLVLWRLGFVRIGSLWTDEIHFAPLKQPRGTIGSLVFTGESSFQGFFGGAKWISQPSTVCARNQYVGSEFGSSFGSSNGHVQS